MCACGRRHPGGSEGSWCLRWALKGGWRRGEGIQEGKGPQQQRKVRPSQHLNFVCVVMSGQAKTRNGGQDKALVWVLWARSGRVRSPGTMEPSKREPCRTQRGSLKTTALWPRRQGRTRGLQGAAAVFRQRSSVRADGLPSALPAPESQTEGLVIGKRNKK